VSLPVVLGTLAAGGWAGFEVWARHTGALRRHHDLGTVEQSWVDEIRRLLPQAWEDAGLFVNGQRPALVGRPRQIEFGVEMRLRTPGAVTVQDVTDSLARLESALNSQREMVGAAEVLRTKHQGHARLRLWATDPLLADNTVPWKPGHVPAAWGEPAVLGRFRDGSPVRAHFWTEAGAVHTLYSGKTGSGKTRWMLGMADHLVQLGALVFILDPVKGIDDESWAPLHPVIAGGWSDIDKAARELRKVSEIIKRRPGWRPGSPHPFVAVLADEVQDFAADKAGKDVLKDMVATWRSKGGTVQAATQLPEVVVLEAPIRTNFVQRFAGVLDSKGEYGAALGGTAPAADDRIPPWQEVPEARGQGYADPDGFGVRRFRGWWASNEWRAEHCLALAR